MQNTELNLMERMTKKENITKKELLQACKYRDFLISINGDPLILSFIEKSIINCKADTLLKDQEQKQLEENLLITPI